MDTHNDGDNKNRPRTLRSVVARFVPRRIRLLLFSSYLVLVDLWEVRNKRRLFGRNSRLVPPLRLMNDGPRDYNSFKQNGEEYFDIMVRLCDLRPGDRILDIGCGIGRKLVPLLPYLQPGVGSYEGIDIYEPHIRWCKKKIGKAYPAFRFQFVDIWSKLYNSTGTIRAREYAFPFGDGSFDFVIMGSVFTHMLTEDMRHYVEEVARLLKPGGRGLITYFLLNDDAERLMAQGKASLQLTYEMDGVSKADNPDWMESAVGYKEKEVLDLFAANGIRTKVHYGSWCGRKDYLTYQDVIVIRK